MPKNKNINVRDELDKFFASSKDDLYSKALHFSNLAYLATSQENKEARKAMKMLNSRASSNVISNLALQLDQMSKNDLQDTKQIHAINAAKYLLLDKRPFANKLSTEAVLILGKDPELCRLAIYRLIQAANPDLSISMPHDLLLVGSRQTSDQVAITYKKASILPDELVKLASTIQNAHIIMAEIAEHSQRFTMTQELIQLHPQLADDVANCWRLLLSSNEIEPKDRKSLNDILEVLEKQYPQFKGIREITRTSRNQLSNEEQMPHKGEQKSLAALFSFVWGVLSGPQALAALKGAGAAASAGVVLGPLLLFGAPIAGALALENLSKSSNNEGNDNIKKVKPDQ